MVAEDPRAPEDPKPEVDFGVDEYEPVDDLLDEPQLEELLLELDEPQLEDRPLEYELDDRPLNEPLDRLELENELDDPPDRPPYDQPAWETSMDAKRNTKNTDLRMANLAMKGRLL